MCSFLFISRIILLTNSGVFSLQNFNSDFLLVIVVDRQHATVEFIFILVPKLLLGNADNVYTPKQELGSEIKLEFGGELIRFFATLGEYRLL